MTVGDQMLSETRVIGWLREHALPITGVEPGNGFADLESLGAALAGVRVVGLGEATHGTREFFQCKHRLFEYLVVKQGFTVFAIEAGYDAGFRVNDYVLYGQGDAQSALDGLKYWTWNTEEVLELIEWIRRYNLSQPETRRVRFYGFDCQSIDVASKAVLTYIDKVAPEFSERANAALAPLLAPRQRNAPDEASPAPATKEGIVDGLYALIGRLAQYRMRFVRLSSVGEYEATLQYARICLQYCLEMAKPVEFMEQWNVRDLSMAENIEYIARVLQPEAKIAVWAHNAHVATCYGAEGFHTMGEHLRRIFGYAYYSMAFVFNKGAFQARDRQDSKRALCEFSLPPAREGTVDWYLSQVGFDRYMVDLRREGKPEAVARWVTETRPMRSIGAAFSKEWTYKDYEVTRPVNSWDGLIYIDSTTRARPNPTGQR